MSNKSKKFSKKFGMFIFFVDICSTTKKLSVITFNITTMAEKCKKQLIYKDYSAVNTNGSPLNVDMTESTNLLGGEIWYNWQTASFWPVRASGIVHSKLCPNYRFVRLAGQDQHISLQRLSRELSRRNCSNTKHGGNGLRQEPPDDETTVAPFPPLCAQNHYSILLKIDFGWIVTFLASIYWSIHHPACMRMLRVVWFQSSRAEALGWLSSGLWVWKQWIAFSWGRSSYETFHQSNPTAMVLAYHQRQMSWRDFFSQGAFPRGGNDTDWLVKSSSKQGMTKSWRINRRLFLLLFL